MIPILCHKLLKYVLYSGRRKVLLVVILNDFMCQ